MNKDSNVIYVETSDSVLISDLLYYVWNKLKCLPTKDVASICHQFYTDDNYVFEQKAKEWRGPKGCHVIKRVENKCATGFREKKGVKIFARNGISGEGVKEGRRRKGRARRRKGGTESQRLSSLESRF